MKGQQWIQLIPVAEVTPERRILIPLPDIGACGQHQLDGGSVINVELLVNAAVNIQCVSLEHKAAVSGISYILNHINNARKLAAHIGTKARLVDLYLLDGPRTKSP